MNTLIDLIRNPFTLILLAAGLFSLNSCGDSWKVDYGESVASIASADLPNTNPSYLGEKVTIDAIVDSVDSSDPEAAIIHLQGGAHANLGHLAAMANAQAPGDPILVSGILRKENGAYFLDPAIVSSR